MTVLLSLPVQKLQNFTFSLQFSDDDQVIRCVGYSMIVVGLLLIMITNCINNRERNQIMSYLHGKVEELSNDENSRAKRNLRNAQLIKNKSELLA